MNLSKEYVDIYNNYIKYINEIKRECRHIEHMKNRALKKDMKATSEEILALEENSDLNNERNKIYNFSNGDIYIGKINKSKLDGQGVYIVNDDKFGFEYIGEFKDDEKDGRYLKNYSSLKV